MKQELIQIIDELSEVIREKGLQIFDKDLLDSALRIYLTNSINQQKKSYSKPFVKNALENEKPANEQLATDKQKFALKKLKVNFPDNLTKKEASVLIGKYK